MSDITSPDSPARSDAMHVAPDEQLDQLARRAATGDRHAKEELVAALTPSLCAFLRRRIPSQDDADDALGDIWLAVFSQFARYDAGRPFRAYLFGIGNTKVSDYWRRRRRRPPPQPIPADFPHDSDDPSLAVRDQEIVDRFRGCWDRLRPDAQELLAMRFASHTPLPPPASVDDLCGILADRTSYAQLAADLNRPASDVGAIRSAVWRAAVDLLTCLGVLPPGGGGKKSSAGERGAEFDEEQREASVRLEGPHDMAEPLAPEQLEELVAAEDLSPGLREFLARSPGHLDAAARVLRALRLAADLHLAMANPVPSADLPRTTLDTVNPMNLEPPASPADEMRLRSLAVMFTDMAGSTAFAERYGSPGLIKKYKAHNNVLLPLIPANRGKLFRIIGDALLVSFDNPADAARCAVDMQRGLARYNREHQEQMEHADQEIHIRIGIHWGKSIVYDGPFGTDLCGQGVNTAARVESAGGKKTDEILLSEATVARLLPAGAAFATEAVGMTEAKGIGEMRIFRLLWNEEEIAAAQAAADRPTPTQKLAAQTAVPSADDLDQAEDTRAVHCLFIDPATAAATIRSVRVRVKPAETPSIRPRVQCDRIMQAAAVRAVEAAFAILRRLGFRDADPARHAVEWWVEGPPADYQGASLGLGLALATAAAYAGAPIAAGVVVTGATDGGRVVHVEGIGHKWQAASEGGFDTLVVPAANLPDLPPAARQEGKLKLLPIDGIEDAVVDLLGPALGLSARRLSAAAPPPTATEGGVNLQLWVQPAGQRELRRDIEILPEEDTHSWQVGDKVRVCVSADRDCHVAVVNLGSSGKVTVLLPNSLHPETLVRAGQPASFPSPQDRFSFNLKGPPGRERLIALASDRPLKLTPQDFDQSGKLVVAQPWTRDIEIVADEAGPEPLGRSEIEFYVSAD